MPKPDILIIEDDPDIQQLVSFYLIKSGFGVSCADSGEEGLRIIKNENVDCVLLDLMLPGIDGMEVCRKLRAIGGPNNRLPIIMLTAKGEDEDIISGLDTGADDYIAKPFSPKVLISRIRALLRRRFPDEVEGSGKDKSLLAVHTIKLDLESHQAWNRGEKLELTISEYRLLAMFVRKPGRVYSRDQIIEAIRGYGYSVTPRSVDVQIHGIRRKLGTDGYLIETVRGLGYRLQGE